MSVKQRFFVVLLLWPKEALSSRSRGRDVQVPPLEVHEAQAVVALVHNVHATNNAEDVEGLLQHVLVHAVLHPGNAHTGL